MWFLTKLIALLNLSFSLIMKMVCKKCFKSVSLVWGGSIVAALLVNMIIVAPQKELKMQIGSQLADKRKEYSALLKIDEEKTRIRMNIQMSQWRDSLNDFVASNEDLAGLTFDIGQMAKGLRIDSFSINPQNGKDSQNAIDGQYICESQMNVNFKSSFNKFAAFLNAVERHKPVIFVNKFTIAHSEQNESVNRVNIDLSVFTNKKQGI